MFRPKERLQEQYFIFFIKSLKSKKKAGTNFIMPVKKYGWAIQKNLICIDQSRFYIFSHWQEFKNV